MTTEFTTTNIDELINYWAECTTNNRKLNLEYKYKSKTCAKFNTLHYNGNLKEILINIIKHNYTYRISQHNKIYNSYGQVQQIPMYCCDFNPGDIVFVESIANSEFCEVVAYDPKIPHHEDLMRRGLLYSTREDAATACKVRYGILND